MKPWLLIAELLSLKGQSLSNLLKSRVTKFSSSGEINHTIAKPVQALKRIKDFCQHDVVVIDTLDGILMKFDDWRFNLRQSNTEPLVC